MTAAERASVIEEIKRYQAMIDNDPNGSASDGWRQRVQNLQAALRD